MAFVQEVRPEIAEASDSKNLDDHLLKKERQTCQTINFPVAIF